MQFLLQSEEDKSIFHDLQKVSSFSSRQQFRNAEIVTVPNKGVGSIAAMAGLCGCCGVYNVLYEISKPDEAEWCDATRRVCVLFEGEVVLSGLAAVASCFQLQVKTVAMGVKLKGTGGARANEQFLKSQPFYPSIYLDPVKWSNNNSNNKKMFRVFVSGEAPNVGGRRLRPGSEVLVLRPQQQQTEIVLLKTDHHQDQEANNNDNNNNQQKNQQSVKKVSAEQLAVIQRRKNNSSNKNTNQNNNASSVSVQDLMMSTLSNARSQVHRSSNANTITTTDSAVLTVNSSNKDDLQQHHANNSSNSSVNNVLPVDEETFIDDMMYRVQRRGTKPLENFSHQIFVGETVWKRIHSHSFFATIFGKKEPEEKGMHEMASATNNNTNTNTIIVQQENHNNNDNHHDVFNQIRRSRPHRRVFAMCSIGQPDGDTLNAIANQLLLNSCYEDDDENSNNQNNTSNLMMMSQNDDGNDESNNKTTEKKTTLDETSFVLFLDLPTLHSANSKKFVLDTLSSIEKVVNRNFLLPLSSRNNNNKKQMREIDIVITCASRFIASPVRFPERALFQKLFIREVRGGQEVLESASLMVSLNTDLMCSWLIEKFAQEGGNGMPFMKLNEFLE